jgi:hypothetical protein
LIVEPDRLMVDEPGVAVIATGLQLLVRPLGVETINPDGNVSVKATPLKLVPALGLVKVKVKVVVPLSGIVVAPNALLMEGGST